MVMTVHSENSCLMVACTRSSVSRSTAAVASSRMRTLVFLRRALARHMSCLTHGEVGAALSDLMVEPLGQGGHQGNLIDRSFLCLEAALMP